MRVATAGLAALVALLAWAILREGGGDRAGPSTVAGVVRGPQDVLWGARVYAFEPPAEAPGSTPPLATDTTRADGSFRLEIQRHVPLVNLAVVPDVQTNLAPTLARDVEIAPGRVARRDLSVDAGLEIEGFVEPPTEDVVVRAAPPNGGDPRDWHRGMTAADGRFRIRGLAPGVYRLVVLTPSVVVERGVAARAGEDGVRLAIVTGFRISGRVRDADTGRPVDRFVATVNGRPEAVEGRDGGFEGFWRDDAESARLRISARGYVDSEREQSRRGLRMHAWEVDLLLVPVHRRAPNVRFTIGYDDGTPYDGEFRFMTSGPHTDSHSLQPDAGGVARAILFPGDWTLSFASGPSIVGRGDWVSRRLHVPESGGAEVKWTIPRWGSVTVVVPEGEGVRRVALVRVESGLSIGLSAHPGKQVLRVLPGEWRLVFFPGDGLPPVTREFRLRPGESLEVPP